MYANAAHSLANLTYPHVSAAHFLTYPLTCRQVQPHFLECSLFLAKSIGVICPEQIYNPAGSRPHPLTEEEETLRAPNTAPTE
jgi:hypothetical protein